MASSARKLVVFAIVSSLSGTIGNHGVSLAQSLSPIGDNTPTKEGEAPPPRPKPASVLRPVLVEADRESPNELSAQKIDRTTIREFPAANGDVKNLLKLNAAAQFDERAQGNRPGEITPPRVSINGTRFYESLYQIDGLSNSSRLDPAPDNANEFDRPLGNPDRFILDTSLLDNVTVYDANIPASFGRFSGGVIDAKSRRGRGDKAHGEIRYRVTRDAWVNYFVDPSQQASFDAPNNASDPQPRFTKEIWNLAAEGPLGPDVTAIYAYSRKKSAIGQLVLNEWKDQERLAENHLAKVSYRAWGGMLDISFLSAPSTGLYYTQNAKDGEFFQKSGGTSASVSWEGTLGKWLVEGKLAVDDTRDERVGKPTWFNWRKAPSKNWGISTSSTEGGFGTVVRGEDNRKYRFSATAPELRLFGRHVLNAGIDGESGTAYLDRANTTFSHTSSTLSANVNCNGNTFDCVDREQYFTRRTILKAGKSTVNSEQLAAYVQDRWQIGRVDAVLGLRWDKDQAADEKNLAPRLSIAWDAFGNESLNLLTGYNRYYSTSILSLQLREALGRTTTEQRSLVNNIPGPWVATSTGISYRRSDVESPYSDERMLGLQYRLPWVNLRLKAVHREHKKTLTSKFVRVANSTSIDYYYLTNDGFGESRNYSFEANSTRLLTLGGSRTQFSFGYNKQSVKDTSRASPSYDDLLSDATLDERVYYLGTLQRRLDLPPDNYARPYTARLNAITTFPDWRLSLSQFARLRGEYEQVIDTGVKRSATYVDNSGASITRDVAVLERFRFSRSLTLDWLLRWESPKLRTGRISVEFELNNVTNRRNRLGSASSTPSYELGRNYWLGAGYSF